MSHDIDLLIRAGLNESQAAAYSLLLQDGQAKPAEAAEKLRLSRTNSYKVFEQLEDLKLAKQKDVRKKLVYFPTNPTNLSNLTAQFRAEATAKENAVKELMQSLLDEYRKHTDKPHVELFSGKKSVEAAYRKQNNLKEDIKFIHTHADLPHMGFDTMHDIRTTPARHGNRREAIMRRSGESQNPVNWDSHERTNLGVTWASIDDYDSPVEWRCTKSSLLIVIYSSNPYAVLIIEPTIAEAFTKLFTMMQTFLSERPTHKEISKSKK